MQKGKSKTRILLWDIETAPNLGYVWGKWEQNVIEFKSNWYILCVAAKWLDEKRVVTHSLPDFRGLYKLDKEDDSMLVGALWKLLDKADVVIAHNGDSFDIKKANARFAIHGMEPPSPYRSIDTRKLAKRYFKFDSNKLDDLGEILNLGRKLPTGGFKTWKGCMQGDRKSWKKMIEYNKQDVLLLEKVYLALRPWMVNHPNINILDGRLDACPTCGSGEIQKRGWYFTTVSKKQRYQCQSCGRWAFGKPEKNPGIIIR